MLQDIPTSCLLFIYLCHLFPAGTMTDTTYVKHISIPKSFLWMTSGTWISVVFVFLHYSDLCSMLFYPKYLLDHSIERDPLETLPFLSYIWIHFLSSHLLPPDF